MRIIMKTLGILAIVLVLSWYYLGGGWLYFVGVKKEKPE